MSTKIGHFEILSELAKSATGAVYKATDPQSNQTVALKTIQLSAFGESASELQKSLLEEAATTKPLSHPNVIPVYGAGEIDGQFCAAMEYIQGNSIATMLARKEGFSIWDMLDIGRQVCAGLDHAQSHQVFHYSLEPAKIMCGWDGAVRILGYGVTSVGKFTGQMPSLPLILHYMSPEQVRGENIDERSNLFSLGAIFYEMITDRKAFDREDAELLRGSILESTPVAPMAINPKVHPVLSDLIMKALSKDPAERYQSGRELLDDLEKCKESKPKQNAAPTQGLVVPDSVKAANQAKFVASVPSAPPAPAKAAAASAAAGQSAASVSSTPKVSSAPRTAAAPKIQAPAQVASPRIRPMSGEPQPSARMSASVLDAPVEVPQADAPRIAVDPMMAEDGGSKSGSVSFSEMTELPPLKETYSPSIPSSPAAEQPVARTPSVTTYSGEPEKPSIQPNEIAQKALTEIKNVPPRLMVYSIAGAAVLILIIAVALVMHVNNLNNDGDSPRPAAVISKPEATQPTAQTQPAPRPAPQAAPAPASVPTVEDQPSVPEAEALPDKTAVPAARSRAKNARKKPVPALPVVVPGQMAIDSTPQGVQVQIDGKSDPSWVTPITLSGLEPGQHSVSFIKSGYVTDTRTVAVASGGKLSVMTHLVQLVATLVVSSAPAGANVYIDGKDTHKLTPAQVSVDKGQHVVLVRKAGYIDETTSTQFNLGQTVSFSPTLRELGNVDDIKTVGKMKKLFGGKEAQGLGSISVRTNPKGAQVAVNQHMLDKDSPVEFVLDPGNYIVDITMSGYAPIHKVITVDKGGKSVIDEVLQRQ